MVRKIINPQDYKRVDAEVVKSFPRFRASAKGVCYVGVSAVLVDSSGECGIVAANIEDLRIRWASMTSIPLDEDLVAPIAIFGLESTSVK